LATTSYSETSRAPHCRRQHRPGTHIDRRSFTYDARENLAEVWGHRFAPYTGEAQKYIVRTPSTRRTAAFSNRTGPPIADERAVVDRGRAPDGRACTEPSPNRHPKTRSDDRSARSFPVIGRPMSTCGSRTGPHAMNLRECDNRPAGGERSHSFRTLVS